MAFLCPVRIKRTKKKKVQEDEGPMPGVGNQGPSPSMGRITGSASIETLVRVGIEKENGLSPESKMVVLHDFTPCVDDELEVKRGQIVHVLYQENDWVYVISEDSKNNNTQGGHGGGGASNEGFIPHSYCAQFGSQLAELALNVKKKLPRGSDQGSGGIQPGQSNPKQIGIGLNQHIPFQETTRQAVGIPGNYQENSDSDSFPDLGFQSRQRNNQSSNPQNNATSRSNSLLSSDASSQPEVHPFYKEATGKFIVLYNYAAQDENDLSVERGQCVTVLNSDDSDWYWVSKYDGSEGFVPSGFIYPLDAIQRQHGLSGGPSGPVDGPPSQHCIMTHQDQIFKAKPGFVTQAKSAPNQHPQQQLSPNFVFSGHQLPQQQLSPTNQRWMNSSGASSSGPPSFTHPPQFSSGPNSFASGYISNGGIAGDLHFGLGGGAPSSYQHSPHKSTTTPLSSSSGILSRSTPTSNQSPGPRARIPIGPPSSSQLNSTSSTGKGNTMVGPCIGMPQSHTTPSQLQPNPSSGGESGEVSSYNGTELVMLYDYKAQAPDDLSVKRGDWIYADLNNQTVDGWLWCFAPKTRKYGFIPKAYARPPAMTSL